MSYNHKGITTHDVSAYADDLKQCSFTIWFGSNPGLALPLIALQYHEVKVLITLGSKTDFAQADSNTAGDLTNVRLLGLHLFRY